MKKSFTQEQIVATLRLVESGTSIAETCRKLGITEQTYYRWKKKFAGMGMTKVRRRLKQPKDKNEYSGSICHVVRTASETLISWTWLLV